MWLRKAYLTFHRSVNARMLNHGVTVEQCVVLSVVAREPGITQIKIVDRTASDPNTVAAIVRLLERRGLLQRHAHGHDGRARCVFLTSVGRRLERQAFKDSEPLRAALTACVSESKQGRTLQFLQRVHHVFSAPLARANSRGPSRLSARKATRGSDGQRSSHRLLDRGHSK
jgi:DNA-binding MarR family transcriptional regulator